MSTSFFFDYTKKYGGLNALIRMSGCCSMIFLMSYKYF
jgi:hypothetical protein